MCIESHRCTISSDCHSIISNCRTIWSDCLCSISHCCTIHSSSYRSVSESSRIISICSCSISDSCRIWSICLCLRSHSCTTNCISLSLISNCCCILPISNYSCTLGNKTRCLKVSNNLKWVVSFRCISRCAKSNTHITIWTYRKWRSTTTIGNHRSRCTTNSIYRTTAHICIPLSSNIISIHTIITIIIISHNTWITRSSLDLINIYISSNKICS